MQRYIFFTSPLFRRVSDGIVLGLLSYHIKIIFITLKLWSYVEVKVNTFIL